MKNIMTALFAIGFLSLACGRSELIPFAPQVDAGVDRTPEALPDNGPKGGFEFCGGGPGEGCCAIGGAKFPTDAPKPLAGMLIKGSQHTVYYIGSDAKRYIFTTRDTLVSWFEGYDSKNLLDGKSDICRTVRQFTDGVLASIQVGKTVTIRPGSYLVRIASDLVVYVVARHRTLRQIGLQLLWGLPIEGALAETFYPGTSVQRVRIVPDGFFAYYNFGAKISSASEYDPKTEWDWGAPAMMERELGIIP